MNYAIDHGYSIAWGADVSESGFNRDGIGVLADVEAIETAGSDQARWIGLSYGDKMRQIQQTISSVDCPRSEEHTSELQSRQYLVCRLLLEKKKKTNTLACADKLPYTHY